ncbi:E3 ubiquitin-protein ligase RNF31-like [Conger conger]|nr:E3 ubiquitin-protein ligase RNF31-like [Conger conger]
MATHYLKEVRGQAEACLLTTGYSPEVQDTVERMAKIPLPLLAKYQLINLSELMRQNCTSGDRKAELSALHRAMSILQKYGCNLANPKRPKYWRTVKHNNPIFRSTVDAIKGGRAALHLYGYTIQRPDGLSFPDDVTDPDLEKVAAVTVEVMAFCAELELFIKETHEHPEFLERIISGPQQEVPELARQDLPPPAPAPAPRPAQRPRTAPTSATPAAPTDPQRMSCTVCGDNPSIRCLPCGSLFCENCDEIFHHHPERTDHIREKLQPDNCKICGTSPVSVQCPTCARRLCLPCDRLYHSHPDRRDHRRIQTGLATPPRALR